jgi:glycerophosphoryl diester phosphodiesterase
MKKILNIGHRGAKGYEPENTLLSFEKALQMGVDGIELDVHISNDGAIMVIHDETIDRTTNGKGFVTHLSLTELKNVRTNKEQQIPILSEVIDLVNKKCLINIELKGNRTAKPIVELVESYILAENYKHTDFLISSFDWNALREVRLLNSKIPIGVLTQTDLDLAIAFATFIKAETIHSYFHLLTKENTRQMQKEGFKVFAWTVNEPNDIQQIKSFNVDGIISDFPDRILNH